MARELTYSKVELYMKDNGRMELNMVMEKLFMTMVKNMMGLGKPG